MVSPAGKNQVGYDSCYEYGVILEGKVMAETTYKFPYDCKGIAALVGV